MEDTSLKAARTTSAVLMLSKRAWKLAVSFSRLSQDEKSFNQPVRLLTEDVKSLVIEADLIYAELDAPAIQNKELQAPRYNLDDWIWECLDTQMEEIGHTMHHLQFCIDDTKNEANELSSQAQRPRNIEGNEIFLTEMGSKVRMHAVNLKLTLLLIDIIRKYIEPDRVDEQLPRQLRALQDCMEKLRSTTAVDLTTQPARSELLLMQHGSEVIAKATNLQRNHLSGRSLTEDPNFANINVRVAEWLRSLDAIRNDNREQEQNTGASSLPHEYEDDLNMDLAIAALESGMRTFEASNWVEASTLLQEAVRILQLLSTRQRAFCDLFDLHYRLAVCAYHTKEPMDAEVALLSFVQQPANSDERCICTLAATHFLSQIYFCSGRFELARIECEKALQGRRRLLGKQSDSSLKSTALMAHIYAALKNRPRAMLYLNMIPEAHRDPVLRGVEDSLGSAVEHLEFSSLLTQPLSDGKIEVQAEEVTTTGHSDAVRGLAIDDLSCRSSSVTFRTPTPSVRQSLPATSSDQASLQDFGSGTATSVSPQEVPPDWRDMEKDTSGRNHNNFQAPSMFPSPNLNKTLASTLNLSGRSLSQKDVLDRIGCQPRDRIEEAVCSGDHVALVSLLHRKTDFWRSKLRKRVRPERLTALHFAALFGELDMARRLLEANFDVNVVPYGYTTDLSPLKMAVGARQVDMVDFLLVRGAKPANQDSWSTIAGLVMNRSWLMKTLSKADRDLVSWRMLQIFEILLKAGWNVNEPFEASGMTVLHQAVTFYTGYSYMWDLNLRKTITEFLSSHRADHSQRNAEGKTPYDLAQACGHQDVVAIFDRDSKGTAGNQESAGPIELST
ncbi:hypothetical protein K491DRAFT_610373 [Lophiostoma macrostomum CBS 122681]|uniref:Uncharacterized protein n=1 Tax=Lophiostoma macrostomum CBS 122681 TaxID=1314788 RepID=A0A6A6SP63_9PLEO|nr:hypothetical protein K491DRAFT_610373 [Lophiostoma macrostomum CBS 122681]